MLSFYLQEFLLDELVKSITSVTFEGSILEYLVYRGTQENNGGVDLMSS